LAKEFVFTYGASFTVMSIAGSIALSGINAATLRLQVSAHNVANARSGGPLPGSANTADIPGAYVPLRVNQTATPGGGTSATVTRSTDKAPTFDTSAYWEFAANPYVALTNELVQQLVAHFDLVANAHVLRADAQQSAALFDTTD
jgi:flagellar basal-body rod protein FlgC